MKTRNLKCNHALKTIALGSLFVLAFTFSHAQRRAEPTKMPSVDLQYMGSINADPVFQVAFDNPQGKEVYVMLKDEYGNIIYSELIKDKAYSRKIQLEDADFSVMKLTVTLRAKKMYETHSFMVNRSLRTIEGIAIAKL